MKTMGSPGYHQNGFVATHALGCKWQVHKLPQTHCGNIREDTLFS